MDKEWHHRKFSTGQIGLKRKTAVVLTNLKCEPRPNDFLFVDRFNAQDHGVTEKDIDENKARDRSKVDHKEDVGANSSEDLIDGAVDKRSIQARSLPRSFFVKRSDQSPRYDIGVSVKRNRSPQEINLSKQSQFINNSASVSERRMSFPGMILSSSATEQISDSTRILTALGRKTKQGITQAKYPSETGKESSDSLPKITKSLETLTTGDRIKRSKSLDEGGRIVIKTSKWSPQSLSSDKSTDRTQGLLEAKIIPESRATTPKTPLMVDDDRHEMENCNKIVQHIRFDYQETKAALPAPIDLVGEYSSWKAKADRGSKGDIEGADLVQSQSGLVERRSDVACVGKKPSGQGHSPRARRKFTSNSKVKVDHRPKSRIPPQKNGPTASDVLCSNPGDELIDLKVKAFLRKHQPKASHGSLKVKAPKHKKPLHPANKLRERRSYERIVVNTDTCPSSNIVTQDRSWYYQDRTGKCRYLRVPESPAPPVEWVFKRTPSP